MSPNFCVCCVTNVSIVQPSTVGVKNHQIIKYMDIMNIKVEITSFIILLIMFGFITTAILVH